MYRYSIQYLPNHHEKKKKMKQNKTWLFSFQMKKRRQVSVKMEFKPNSFDSEFCYFSMLHDLT